MLHVKKTGGLILVLDESALERMEFIKGVDV